MSDTRPDYSALFDEPISQQPKYQSSSMDLSELTGQTFLTSYSPIPKAKQQRQNSLSLSYRSSSSMSKRKKNSSRLFELSCRPKPVWQEPEDPPDPTVYKSRNYLDLSDKLVNQAMKKLIDDAIGSESEINRAGLSKAFSKLGILEGKMKIYDKQFLRDQLEIWELDDNVYDNDAVRETLYEAAENDLSTKFKRHARNRMFEKMYNKKAGPAEIKDEYTGSHQISNFVFDRLIEPKKEFSNEEDENEQVIEPVKLSKKTVETLVNSYFGQLPYHKRQESLQLRKKERLDVIKEEIKQKEKYEYIEPEIPELTPQQREEIEIMNKKKEKEKELSKPTYRPEVTKYEDYLKIKPAIYESKEKPHGYDEILQRMKEGREKREEEKNRLWLPPPPISLISKQPIKEITEEQEESMDSVSTSSTVSEIFIRSRKSRKKNRQNFIPTD